MSFFSSLLPSSNQKCRRKMKNGKNFRPTILLRILLSEIFRQRRRAVCGVCFKSIGLSLKDDEVKIRAIQTDKMKVYALYFVAKVIFFHDIMKFFIVRWNSLEFIWYFRHYTKYSNEAKKNRHNVGGVEIFLSLVSKKSNYVWKNCGSHIEGMILKCDMSHCLNE